jgi:hypothetical protein
VGAGLQVMQTLMEESVTALAGPKGKHNLGGFLDWRPRFDLASSVPGRMVRPVGGGRRV